MSNLHDLLLFFTLTCLHRIPGFIGVIYAAIFIHQFDNIVHTLYNYNIAFSFVLIFYEKLQLEVGYRFT